MNEDVFNYFLVSVVGKSIHDDTQIFGSYWYKTKLKKPTDQGLIDKAIDLFKIKEVKVIDVYQYDKIWYDAINSNYNLN